MSTGCGLALIERRPDYGLWIAECWDCDWRESRFGSEGLAKKAWHEHAGRISNPARYEETVSDAA